MNKRLKRRVLSLCSRSLRKRGFSRYMSREWVRMVYRNLRYDKTSPVRQKLWCYRRGYMPYRVQQYGITEENYTSFLSDRDYCYLHPINNSFTKWINDKVSPRYILQPFSTFLPACYYHLIRRNRSTQIVRLIDCPPGYTDTSDDILRLLREKGALAFKRSAGAHGYGFYKLSYEDGTYSANNQPVDEEKLLKMFDTIPVFYVVTEYIQMHEEIKRLYPESVNTIRIMTINTQGNNPFIGDAYMRIGSMKTGVTDNVAYGGVFARVDLETGRYYQGEQLRDHVITPCPQHPDTGVLIEGVLPNWETVKTGVLDICRFIPQLEYLGFDIAITDTSFKLLEINVHQDLHRFPHYSPEVKEYFFKKLQDKQACYRS